MELSVNGKHISIEPQPGEMLSDLLRERLNLTGTKIGCNEAECGACTVLIDGQPVLSCTYPTAKAEGKSILTIEGLANQGAREHGGNGAREQGGKDEIPLHPLQEAFISHGRSNADSAFLGN